MKKITYRIFNVIFTILFIISATLSYTFAWQNANQTSLAKAAGEPNVYVNVELHKKEKSESQSQLTKYIPNTVFYLFKKSGEQIGNSYVTDENGKISVSLTKGEYYFEEITPSIGYTHDNIDNKKVTIYPFTVNGTEEETIIVNAYNVKLQGSLTISKVIENADNSILTKEQLNQDFIFTITFSDKGTYEYIIDNGEKKTIASGEKLTLKHGQTAIFDEIPVGVLYNIQEEKTENYISTSSNHQGHITEEGINAVFTNTYDPSFTPSEENIKLTVTKKLEGEYLKYEKEKDFEFILLINNTEKIFTLKDNETKEFELPKGSTYEIREKDYFEQGYAQSITNGSGIAYQDNIEVNVTNTYVGEVKKEISGEKKWDLKDNTNVIMPESITIRLKNGNIVVQEKEITQGINNKWTYSFIAPKYDNEGKEIDYTVEELEVDSFKASYDGYNITNTYIKPVEVKLPTVKKVVKGKNVIKTKFNFMLQGENVPMPSNSEENIKTMTLQGQGEIDFGTITFKKPGTYEYTIFEINNNIKGWIYDNSIYKIKIIVTEENNELQSKTIIEKKNKTTKEIIFTNTYDPSINEENIVISGKISWDHGSNPKSKHPSSVIVYVYGNNKLVMQKQITKEDNWRFTFKLPKYDKNNKIIKYNIDQKKIDNYKKTVNGYNIHNKYIDPSTVANPYTRDNMMIWFIIAMISGIALVIMIAIYLKNEYENNKKLTSDNKEIKK